MEVVAALLIALTIGYYFGRWTVLREWMKSVEADAAALRRLLDGDSHVPSG